MFEDAVEFESAEESERPVKFYYNREERVAKASEQVKEYYRGGMRPVKGIKVLFTGNNKFILFALIFFVGASWIYSGLNGTRKYASLAGIEMELSAFAYEEEIYASLSMKNEKTSKKRGFSNLIPKKLFQKSDNFENSKTEKIEKLVEAEFFFIEVNNQLQEKKSFVQIFDGTENSIRTKTADYDIIRVDVIVNVGDEEKELSCEVKR